MWGQKRITLKPRRRGFHLVTQEILEQLPELAQVRVGLLHVFIQHTSASPALRIFDPGWGIARESENLPNTSHFVCRV